MDIIYLIKMFYLKKIILINSIFYIEKLVCEKEGNNCNNKAELENFNYNIVENVSIVLGIIYLLLVNIP